MSTIEEYRWGVAYEFDELGNPAYVEEADDETDAYAWAQAQGGTVVRQRVGTWFDGLWRVMS